MLDTGVRRARYAVGNIVRFLSAPWRQSVISPEDAVTIFGCSFGQDGWHHLRETLRQYDENPHIPLRRTTLWRFLKYFQPAHTFALIGGSNDSLPLFVYPWGTFDYRGHTRLKDARTSRFCGPSDDGFIEDEYGRTLELYAKVKQYGYQPWRFPNSFIGGTWLVARDGRRRFVVLQGNHRMAMLAHLGFRHIPVRLLPRHISVVRESDIDRWPAVRAGLCTPTQARDLFLHFFNQSGQRLAEMLPEEAPQG